MKVRIKFEKTGVMKFIGHLDMMRYFQKAFRRADIPVRFTEGFSPHMVLSFASPLGVGITSSGEYMDLELTVDSIDREAFLGALNAQMVEGVRVLDVTGIKEGKGGKAMALVAAADYLVRCRDDMSLPDGQSLKAFLSQPEIMVLKEGKKGMKSVNIRPLIYCLRPGESGGIFMRLAAGSEANLKPESVMDELMVFCGQEAKGRGGFLIHRIDLYASKEKTENEFVSLNDLGDPL